MNFKLYLTDVCIRHKHISLAVSLTRYSVVHSKRAIISPGVPANRIGNIGPASEASHDDIASHWPSYNIISKQKVALADPALARGCDDSSSENNSPSDLIMMYIYIIYMPCHGCR